MPRTRPAARPVPSLALSRTGAAESLGVSVDFFDDHVAHELPVIRRGRLKLYPVGGLVGWIENTQQVTVTRTTR